MSEWKKVKLGNLLEEYCERNDNQKYKAVAVGKYGIRKREDIYSKDLSKDISKNKIIKKDTLTIGMGSAQIDIGILTEDDIFCVSPAYTTYKIKKCNSKFLEYYLEYLNPKLSDLFMIVSARQGKNVDKDGMLRHEVMIPPIEEQEKIVKILKNVDSIINLYEKLLEEKNQFIKSQFVEMFGSINNSQYEIKKLEEIVDKNNKYSLKRGPFGGSLKKDDFVDEGYLVYEQRHAIHNDFEYEKYYIDKEKYNSMEMFKVIPGDLIVSCSGVTLGRIAEIPSNAKEGIINQALLKISLDNRIMNNAFFIQQFRSDEIQNYLFGFSRGSGIPNFPSMNEVKKLKFICPNMDEQLKYENIIYQIDKQKIELEKLITNYKVLKKGLMQQLLTGKIRVKI